MIRRQFIKTAVLGIALGPQTLLARATESTGLSVFIIGDWGTGGAQQRRVALGMRNRVVTSGRKPAIILSNGDNIYPNGVGSVDDPQWTSKYTKIYSGYKELDVPWWAILGNHDHRGNVDAQIAYGKVNRQWNMPDRTWSTTLPVTSSTTLGVTGIDTTPLLQQKDGWKQQLQWLDDTLSRSAATVKIVAGHHPLRSYGHYGDTSLLVTHLKPILDRHAVRIYTSGHDHDLQGIKHPSDVFSCVVSGAVGGTRPSTRGRFTNAFHQGGGFADLRIFGDGSMVVELCDESGRTVESMSL